MGSKFDITTGQRAKAIYLQDTKKGDNTSSPVDLSTFEFYQHSPLVSDGIKYQAMAFRLRVVIHFQALKEDKDVVHIDKQGSVALYVDLIIHPNGDEEKRKPTDNTGWGDLLTIIPKDEIKLIEVRMPNK